MRLKELTNEEFMKFTDSFEQSSVFQTPEYAMVMNKQKYDSFYLGMVDDYGNIVAASLILVELLGKFQYAYAPRGFLINYENKELLSEFTTLVKKFLKKKSIMAIKICPIVYRSVFDKERVVYPNFEEIYKNLKSLGFYHLGFNNYFEAFKPRFEAMIPLKDSNTMFNKIRKEFRTKIRMSDKTGIRIYKGTEQNLSYFYKMTKNKYPRDIDYFKDAYELYARRGMVDIYFALLDTKAHVISVQKELQRQAQICSKATDEIFKNQGHANATIIRKRVVQENRLAELKKQLIDATNILNQNPDGVIVACAMVVKYKKEAYLFMDGYEKDYKRMNAKHLLIWKLMDKYAKEGYETLNLGGIANPDNPGNYKGLNDFRLGFGSLAIEYVGDMELITSRPLYMMYRNGSPIRNIMKK